MIYNKIMFIQKICVKKIYLPVIVHAQMFTKLEFDFKLFFD